MRRPAALALCVLLALGAPVTLQALRDVKLTGQVERVAVCAPVALAISATASSQPKLSISGKCWGDWGAGVACKAAAAPPAPGSAPGTGAASHNLAADRC